MPGPPSESPETLLVTALAAGGDGVARLESGRVVFVEGGVPGDRVELASLQERRGTLRARIGRIAVPSGDRVEPACPHFTDCGGCTWQHVRYAAQLEAKREIVRAAIERIGGLRFEREIEIVASPDAYHYRARTRIVEAEGGVGYRRRASNEAMRVESCPVLVPALQAALAAQGQRVAAAQARGRGAAARRAPDGRPRGPSGRARGRAAALREWVITAGSEGPARIAAVGELAERPGAGGSREEGAIGDAPGGEVAIGVLGERLRIGGPGFIQGNALLWERLASEVVACCLRPRSGEAPRRFVELYAGIGFFTLPLARRGLSGIAVESDPQAVADLVFNLSRAGLSDAVTPFEAQVERRIDLPTWLVETDLLLVDPPRAGLDAIVRESIAKSGPGIVVYVSCDPATLARDLKPLVAEGYRIESIVAFDLFPQTPHVETVVRLER
ncbi:MAG: TRAM domain-containing protein [Myxococcota bacterium]